eukprot:4244998-Pyramimonas_sp.AAC.1
MRDLLRRHKGVRWGYGRRPFRARNAWQARCFLDAAGGAPGVRLLSVSVSQSVAGAALLLFHLSS